MVGAVGGRLGFSLWSQRECLKHSCRRMGGRRKTGPGTGNRRADVSECKDRSGDTGHPGHRGFARPGGTVGEGFGMGIACAEAGEMIAGRRTSTQGGIPSIEGREIERAKEQRFLITGRNPSRFLFEGACTLSH